jgi:hypothetical protein
VAFTERYVSVAGAGAHDGTSEANAWTLAEAITNAVAGQRVNIKAGSYSQGAATLPVGTPASYLVWRGYNSAIGDLDAQGRNSNGTLNTTNFPAITVTGIIVVGDYSPVQNLSFTGALSSTLLGGVNPDGWSLIRCSVVNSQNNSAARCVLMDNSCAVIDSDLYCSGADHASPLDADVSTLVYGSRIRGTSASRSLVTIDTGTVVRNAFIGPAGNGVLFQTINSLVVHLVSGNTFYDVGTAVSLPAASMVAIVVLINNHATDSTKWIDNLNSATATTSVIEANNRLRDITTPRTGVETVTFGEVTTDTGGHATDYTDATNGDFGLISGAPGRAVGLPVNTDIGAYQHTDARGGTYQLGVV